MPVRVHIASHIRADAASLGEHQAETTGVALAAASQRALARSRAEVLDAMGGRTRVRLNEPVLSWTGERAADVEPAARAAIEQALRAALARAIGQAGLEAEHPALGRPARGVVGERFDPARYDRARGAYAVPSYQPAPGAGRNRQLPVKQQQPARSWRVHTSATFHVTPAHFFDIQDKVATASQAPDHDLRALHAEVLDAPRPATAWVVEVLRETELRALAGEALGAFWASRSAREVVYGVYGLSWMRDGFVRVDEDHTLAGKVPRFDLSGYFDETPATAGTAARTVLRPGGWLLMVFLPLPRVELEDLVKIETYLNPVVKLRDLAGFVDEDLFADSLNLRWAEAETMAGDSKVRLIVETFTVRRRMPAQRLAALLEPPSLIIAARRVGRVMALTEKALAPLTPTLQQILRPRRAARPHAPDGPMEDGTWPVGAQGAAVDASFEGDLTMQVFAGLNLALWKAGADEVARILQLTDGVWSQPRADALETFIDHWSKGDARIFELILAELDRRHLLEAFVEAVRTLRGNFQTQRRRDVLALISRTRFASDPRVAALAGKIQAEESGTWKFRYDIDAQEIWINGDADKRLRAAGSSTDDKAGVVAEVDSFYAESARVYQLGPDLLEKLREPTRKKVGELMARMVCSQGETLSREELITKASQEAAKELKIPPEEKDFVKVTMTMSVRVLKLERRVELGVTQTYVTFQDVRRIGDGPWEPVGEVKEDSPYAFEARLLIFQVKHEIDLLGTVFLAEMVVAGGIVVIEVGVGAYTLAAFVGLRELIYFFTTDQEDRSLDGYLVAALQGELDAVGFKLLAGAAKAAAGVLVEGMLEGRLITEAGAKWIAFGLRGTITATGFGASAVVEQFAQDLFHYSLCEGWPSPSTYWDRFKTGFKMGLLMEFVAIPLLAPPFRYALERATTVVEAARVLRASGKSVGEIGAWLLRGSENLEGGLAQTIERTDVVAPMTRSMRSFVGDVLKSLGREYQSRAYSALLDLYGPELSGQAARGLRRLLGVAGEGQIDEMLQKLLARKLPPAQFLAVLDGLEDKVLADLTRTGQLDRLAASPRVQAWLTRSPAAVSKLLGAGPFKSSVDQLEGYLKQLEVLSPDARESVLGAIIAGHPASPSLLFAAAQEVGVLDEPTLALLRRLSEADIQIGPLFNNSGPSLRSFAEQFGKFPAAQQDFALRLARGRPPQQVLALAARARSELKAVAQELEPTPERLRQELQSGTRAKGRALVLGRLREGTYQNAILETVLLRQARQLAALRNDLLAFSPDALIGAERSGPFLADSAAAGEPQLASRIVRVPKAPLDAMMADMRARIEAMIAPPKSLRRFAFTESLLSGSAVNKLQNDVIAPLARLHPDCRFRGYWLREGLGAEARVSATGAEILPSPGGLPNIQSKAFDVPFIVGEDAPRIIEGTGHEPLYVFDNEGNIVEVLEPRPGETTRDMIIRIMRERGGP